MWEPTVESVMTKEVVTARPGTTFKELVALMSEHRVSGLPVVDEAGRPVGVVSEADTLVKQEHRGGGETRPWFGRQRRARWRKATGRTAGDLMTAPAVTIGTDATVTAAARVLAEKNIRRLCVVDADGMLAGVIARRDVIGMFLRDDAEIRADIEERVFKKGMWLFPGSLTVEVVDGVATVDGSVERRTTAQIAGKLTQAIPGVVAVRNNVRYQMDDTVTSPL
ncbi:MAG: CBS domain-containing protein [Actinophytocola sp.]|uniref:CBS domain-containing protein n=1 Tax=Actinophytocola sp. TaxID=1872138 RepID=UPI001328BA48|nr:CBS domain-containing protein [Actinophytocola sp.]MPZ78961.1 CBS domain-containing protein [Actinophytocola sp.]